MRPQMDSRNNVRVTATELLEVVEIPEPDTETDVFDWCVRDGCARYLLEHMDISQIKTVRNLKIFTPEEAMLIPQYIEQIQQLWETLCKLLPCATFVTKI